jgi:hypothetical protein
MLRIHQELYDALPLNSDQIRILTLRASEYNNSQVRCELRTVSFKDKPSYLALSYTWGTKTEPGNVLANNEAFSATVNLRIALEQFRDAEKDVHFWVDAICIDQENDVEKGEQLQMIRHIFSDAEETWVWLGAEANDSNKAIDLIEVLSGFYREHRVETDESKPDNAEMVRWGFPSRSGIEDELVALEDLFSRDYWYRVWVVQEIAVSRNVKLFCGERSLDWDQVLTTAYLLDAHVEIKHMIRQGRAHRDTTMSHQARSSIPIGRNINTGVQRIISVQSVRNDMLMEKKDTDAEPPDSLLFLLSSHRSTEATQAKDKYFALAGLAKIDSADSVPSYVDPTREIFISATELIAKERASTTAAGLALDFLDCAGQPIREEMDDLPSWVPDWSSYKPRTVPLLYWQFSGTNDEDVVQFNASNPPIHTARTTFQIVRDKGRLLAPGFEFDTVCGVGFSNQSSSFDSSVARNHSGKIEPQEYPTKEDLADVVWKTCVLSRGHRGQVAPSDWGDLFHVLNYTALNCKATICTHPEHRWFRENRRLKICGRTMEEMTLQKILSQKSEPRDANLKQSPDNFARFSTAFSMAVGYRRLATTAKGYLCMAPFDTQPEDIVTILNDCRVPVVLRAKEGHYKLIGTCYVHGIMNGEGIVSNGLGTKTFDIR